jgi:two-component system repressor protein LuxO
MNAADPSVPARILVVEDTPTQAELARMLLGGLGYQARIAASAGAALVTAREWQPDVILVDIELSDYNGFELMQQLLGEGITAAVIVVTANASINAAVQAMRAGAVDFIVKPYSKARLAVTVASVLEKRSQAGNIVRVKSQPDRHQYFGFIGSSLAMQAAYRTIESVAASKASVFITGESGTGKELAAEAVHRASPRAARNFVALNCGAIPRDLLESEVFGHVKGAFTGATSDREGAAKLADGGTLFLDEIGEMPLDMQVKLLRFVQTGTYSPVGASKTERVDVRFVCATNRDPMQEVRAGRFREDLYYRLYVVPVELPPLRAREGDMLAIARHFLTQFSREEQRHFTDFSTEAVAALQTYDWPGNVRQLQNVVRNVVVLHDAAEVTAEMLPPPVYRPGVAPAIAAPTQNADPIAASTPPPPVVAPAAPPQWDTAIVPLAVMERRLIEAALKQTGNDVPRAAALLEINPSTIYRKLQTWRTADESVADPK